MKKYLFIILLAPLFFGLKSVSAADNSNPVTVEGNRIMYNTPYYLRDKNLPNRGGVTYEAWASYDYAIFAHSSNNAGTPIIFESPSKKTGFIDSEDIVAVKSTSSNWYGDQYWHFTSSMNANSVWLSNDGSVGWKIYGQSSDKSIGLGSLGFENFGGAPIPVFIQAKGSTASKAWMTAQVTWLSSFNYPPLAARQTPFLISEVTSADFLDGRQVSIRARGNTTRAMDISETTGELILWNYYGASNQNWNFKYDQSTNSYTIELVGRPGWYLSSGIGTSNKPILTTGVSSRSRWRIQERLVGQFQIINVATGFALDAENNQTSEGTPVILWHNTGDSNQLWSFVFNN